MTIAANMNPALGRTEHRPWPIPSTGWMWRQTWHDLLFAHWPVPVAALRSLVPAWLTVQEFAGSSWVGLVPFRMTGVTLRYLPALPVVSHFPEMNLRLYVERDGKPGIWFISLDAARRSAVITARVLAHLPYFFSRMSVRAEGESVVYSSIRTGSLVAFEGTYAPAGPVREPVPGSMEHFLAERYCLYTQNSRGQRLRLNIHHWPWPLQVAEAEFVTNRVAQPQGIQLPDTPPLLHFSRRLEVVGWGFERI